MAFPLIFGIGAGLGIFSQMQADKAEIRARLNNAASYRKQREAMQLSAAREFDIFTRESDVFLGDQVSGLARAGVDMSGSALMSVIGSKVEIDNEKQAMRMGAERQARLFKLAEKQERDEAKRLNSFEHKFTSYGTQIFNAYTGALGAGLLGSLGGGEGSSSNSGIVGKGAGGGGYSRLAPSGVYSWGATRYEFTSPLLGSFGGL